MLIPICFQYEFHKWKPIIYCTDTNPDTLTCNNVSKRDHQQEDWWFIDFTVVIAMLMLVTRKVSCQKNLLCFLSSSFYHYHPPESTKPSRSSFIKEALGSEIQNGWKIQ